MIEIPGDDGPGQQRSNGKSVLNVARRSNLRGDLFQPDQAGERADFLDPRAIGTTAASRLILAAGVLRRRDRSGRRWLSDAMNMASSAICTSTMLRALDRSPHTLIRRTV
jgi:hypothetical protein